MVVVCCAQYSPHPPSYFASSDGILLCFFFSGGICLLLVCQPTWLVACGVGMAAGPRPTRRTPVRSAGRVAWWWRSGGPPPGGVSHRHKRPQKGLVPPLATSLECSGASTDTSTETSPPTSGSQTRCVAATASASPAAAPGRVLMYQLLHSRLLRPIAGRDRPGPGSVSLLLPSEPDSFGSPGFGSPTASSLGPSLVTSSVVAAVPSVSVVAGLLCSFASTVLGTLPLVRAMSSASVCSAGMP